MPTLAYARTYGVANTMNQMTSENGTPVTWYGSGDMSSDGVNTYVYTYGHRLVQATRTGMSATYDYDIDDRRTRKIVNGVMTRTMWSGADELAQLDVNGDLIRRFVPDGTGAMDARLATVEGNGDLYWHHTDHQSLVIATSKPDGGGGNFKVPVKFVGERAAHLSFRSSIQDSPELPPAWHVVS